MIFFAATSSQDACLTMIFAMGVLLILSVALEDKRR